MAGRTRWGFFTVEFGWFGWGAPPRPTLPHTLNLGLVRVAWGHGSIDSAILLQMSKGNSR